MDEVLNKPATAAGEENEESFAELFEKSFKEHGKRLAPGEKVTAQVLKISGEWVFLNTGRKGEGVLDRKELLDAEGNLTVKEGDTITAWFLSSSNNEMRFTTRLGGAAVQNQLEEAWKSGIPVEGHVEKEVKGGFEVKVAGNTRAFCPFSQMGLRRTDNPGGYVGMHLPFRVTEYGERGRNIVLSHRAILEEELRQQREGLRDTLREGMKIKGTVTSIRDFGAFVSMGCMEGLIPISEIGWSRVADIHEVLAEGQEVEVVIKQIDWEKERISFSLKDAQADPWETVPRSYPEGSFHTGRIARLAPFGAFVTLAAGVDGLIHISRLGAGKRISHPREVLKEGDLVEIKVEGMDRENRRVALSLAGPAKAAEEEEARLAAFRSEAAGSAEKSMGSLGDMMKVKQEKRKK
ncbi:MAG TPA: 30S ribosomal protein S1 [Geobacteraceae bacterium]|nr:30S ribosomal protein S1 [Geobacteraceae bacterium]